MWSSTISSMWGATPQPVGEITKGMRGQYRGVGDTVRGQHGCAQSNCNPQDSSCNTCNILHKHVDLTEIGPVENKDQLFPFESQFNTPLAGWTNAMKDSAIRNNGSLGDARSEALGTPFSGRILPPTFKHGTDVHKTYDPCFKAGGVDKIRYVNANREALDNCEMYCGYDVCKEYANALEKYGACVRANKCGDEADCLRRCGPPPVNPRLNGCGKKKECCLQTKASLGLPFPTSTPYNACRRRRFPTPPDCTDCKGRRVKLIPGGKCC